MVESPAGRADAARSTIVRLSDRVALRRSAWQVDLDAVKRAEERILRFLRHTPMMTTWLRCDDGSRVKVNLKLENLQVTEGFTVRGVLNAAMSLPRGQLASGLVGYGALHGAAVAYVAHALGVPSVVYLYPTVATLDLVQQMRYWGATLLVEGKTLVDARRAAIQHAGRDGLTFINPSASRDFLLGCATIALEMLEFVPDLDVIVASAGYGALLGGVAAVAKQMRPAMRVIGVDREAEARSRPTDSQSVAGRPIHRRLVLGAIARDAAPSCLALIDQYVDNVVLVRRPDTAGAAGLLWTEMEVRTGHLGAGAVAAIMLGRVRIKPGESVGAIVSSSGGEGLF
jgi:threonine dehydratase